MYFMRVFEERSFTNGAKRANVVQPALSRQIALLEKELNATLFIRGHRGAVPTDAAVKLYERVLPLVGGLANVKEEIRALAGQPISGRLVCGFPPTINRAVVGKVLVDFLDLYPDVDVSLFESFSGQLTEMVQSGALDFALGAIPEQASNLTCDFIYSEEVVLGCGEPIAGPPFRPCRLDELPALKLVLPPAHNVMSKQIHALIAAGQLRPSKIVTVDSISAMSDLVWNGGWASFSPISGVLNQLGLGKVFVYPIERPKITYCLGLMRQHDRPMTAAGTAFLGMFSSYAARIRPAWEALVAERQTVGD
jgi:LysR family transcriptional regulator, nitrogen assimilation regulatory protein